ncbi:MAG: glycoside hydrolase family 43 protein [Phycisphaerales bacterium]
MNRSDIHIRDPFIVPVYDEKIYYMYGTTDRDCWDAPGVGFDVYKSTNLEDWDGPYPAFRPPFDFWAEKNFWAPEVYQYDNKYYMFASFFAKGKRRGAQSLISQSPLGPFIPNSKGVLTPEGWDCLDGTLYIDEQNPWMIFCHEWVQIGDGTICAVKLNKDLEKTISEPIKLFKASSAPWAELLVIENAGLKGYVTDGPFLYRTSDKQLLMIWSSFKNNKYALGVAHSTTGRVTGPWIHASEPLFSEDGGHGMLFRTFDGQLMLSIHKPNKTPDERPMFLAINEIGGKLRLK